MKSRNMFLFAVILLLAALLCFGTAQAGHTLPDDDLITVEYLGKGVGEKIFSDAIYLSAYYRLNVTNHSGQDIVFIPGENDLRSEGDVDGVNIQGKIFSPDWLGGNSRRFDNRRMADGEIGVAIPAGATEQICILPWAKGYGFQTVQELVNATLYIRILNDPDTQMTGIDRMYTLRLNEGETWQRKPSAGYKTYRAASYGQVFSYEVPDDWQVYDQNWFFGSVDNPDNWYCVALAPPQLTRTYDTKIEMWINSRPDLASSYSEPWKDLGIVSIGGRSARGWQLSGGLSTFYSIACSDGCVIEFMIDRDKSFADQVDPVISRFLSSIRFGADAAEPDSSAASSGSSEEVLVDDELCRIVLLGKAEYVSSAFGSEPCFSFEVTNKTDRFLYIAPGHLTGDPPHDPEDSYGTVDESEPRFTPLSDYGKNRYLYGAIEIPAGEKDNVLLIPRGGGYGYQSTDDLVNAVLKINVASDSPMDYIREYRNYTLYLEQGKESPWKQSGWQTVTADEFGFTFDIPDNWKAGWDNTDSGVILLLTPPPSLAKQLDSIVKVSLVGKDALESMAAAKRVSRLEDTVLGSRTAVRYAVRSGRGSYLYWFIPATGDELIRVQHSLETDLAEKTQPLVEHILQSIRFTE